MIESIKKGLKQVINFLLPQNENIERLLNVSQGNLRRLLPKAEVINDSLSFPIFSYRNKDVRTLLWALKYKNNTEVLSRLAQFVYEEILEVAEEKMMYEGKNKIALIPIPMNKSGERHKGFNQTEVLCQEIRKISQNNFEVWNILEKTRETKHQAELKRSERLENMRASMQVNINAKRVLNSKARGKNYLLIIIDDVYTTGATIKEARRALSEIGMEDVLAITIAH